MGVAGWGPTGTGSLNHYAIVVQELVIDATGQQFVGGMASITPWSEWLSQLESRIPPPLLARYVRGGKGQAQGLAADRDATYFSTDGQGKPLHQYDAKDIAKRKEDLAKRTARVPSRESDEESPPRLKIKRRSDEHE